MTSYTEYERLASEYYRKLATETDPVQLQKYTDLYMQYIKLANTVKSPAAHQQQALVSSGYGVYNSVNTNPLMAGYCGSPPNNRGGCCATAVW